jgi:universal stress protein E
LQVVAPRRASSAPKLGRILVAIKPWERGLPLAGTHARQLAQALGAEIRLVSTVFDTAVAAARERGDAPAIAQADRLMRGARVELERLAQSMREWGASVTTKVVWGASVYESILAAVREWRANLLVVGVHEQRPFHARLTDTDWQLMRHAPCPMLLVKDPVFDGYATVVAAVDPLHAHAEPSGLDRSVLATGRAVARAYGSKLKALHAYPGEAAFELASAVQVAPGVLYGSENVTALHRRAVAELAEEYGVAEDDIDLVEGPPAEVILAAASAGRSKLVVVGVPQRRGRLAAVIGSTAEAVAAEAPCDVLLVPAQRR